MASAAVSSVFNLVCPSTYGDNVVAGFSALQEQKRMTDFTIKTNGGKSIHVHKMLLSVASAYFSAMFESGMKEVEDDEVNLETQSEKAVCDVVDYIYGRQVTIKWEQIEDYLDVIGHFQLSNMKKQVDNCIMTEIDASNAIHLCKVATKYNMQELKVKAKAVIKSDFYKVVNANDLDLSDMLELMRDKDLMSVGSNLKLKVVIAWVKNNEEERKEGFAQLVDYIELEQCSTGYLGFVLETHQNLLKSQSTVTAHLSRALASGLSKGKHLAIGGKFAIVGGVTSGEPFQSGESFHEDMFRINMNAGTVEDAGKVPDALHRWQAARCVTPSGALFSACGGKESYKSSTTNDCFLFDPDTMSVTHLPPPPEPRLNAGAAAIGTKLYLLGGDEKYSKMSCLDLITEKWSECADLIYGVCCPIVCSIGKYIYVLTGIEEISVHYNDDDPIHLQCYDSERDQWTIKASPPHKVKTTAGASSVAVWNNFYVVGGEGQLCLSYSTTDDMWCTLNTPSKEHYYGSAVHLDGKIVLCGGFSSGDVIEEYNLTTNMWKQSSLTFPYELCMHVCLNN